MIPTRIGVQWHTLIQSTSLHRQRPHVAQEAFSLDHQSALRTTPRPPHPLHSPRQRQLNSIAPPLHTSTYTLPRPRPSERGHGPVKPSLQPQFEFFRSTCSDHCVVAFSLRPWRCSAACTPTWRTTTPIHRYTSTPVQYTNTSVHTSTRGLLACLAIVVIQLSHCADE